MTWSTLLRRDLLRHPGRSAASAAAIAIGVAAYVAVTAGVQAVLVAIDRAGGAVDPDAADLFRSIDASLAPLAATSLVLGGFLIHLVFTRSVHDHQREHAVLRALGVSRVRLVGVVVGQAAIVGLAGAVAGVGAGLAGGRATSSMLTQVFDLAVADVPGNGLPWAAVARAFGLALAVSCVAAAVPAWRVARVDPAVTLRGDPRPPAAAPPWRIAVGGAILVAGLMGVGYLRWRPVASTAVVVGVVLAAPVLVTPLGRLVGRFGRGRRIELHLVGAELGGGRSALAAACGSLAAALALSTAVATVIASQRPAFLEAIRTNLGADAVAVPLTGPLTPQLVDEVRADPAVAAITAYGETRVALAGRGGDEALRVIDPLTYFDVTGLAWTRGTSEAEARQGLLDGGAVVGATLLADLGLEPGDPLVLRSGAGATTVPIVGAFVGFSYGDLDAVVVTEATAQTLVGYTGPGVLLLDLQPGRALAAHGLALGTQEGLRRQIEAQYDGIWGLVVVILVLLSVIAVLALANTLVLHVIDQAPTFGVLRAIGVTAGSVGRVVVVEALVLTAAALVVGLGTGHAFGRGLVAGGTPGVELPVAAAVPWWSLPVLVLATTIAGLAGAVVPARYAAVDPGVATRVPV